MNDDLLLTLFQDLEVDAHLALSIVLNQHDVERINPLLHIFVALGHLLAPLNKVQFRCYLNTVNPNRNFFASPNFPPRRAVTNRFFIDWDGARTGDSRRRPTVTPAPCAARHKRALVYSPNDLASSTPIVFFHPFATRRCALTFTAPQTHRWCFDHYSPFQITKLGALL
jgi:hypothetical protein